MKIGSWDFDLQTQSAACRIQIVAVCRHIQSRPDFDDDDGMKGHGDDGEDDSVADGDHSSRATETSRFSLSIFMSILPQTHSLTLGNTITWKIQHLPKYVSLRCSFQVMHYHPHIPKALKEATIKLAFMQDYKQVLE